MTMTGSGAPPLAGAVGEHPQLVVDRVPVVVAVDERGVHRPSVGSTSRLSASWK